jgi:hypothetical protein
MALRIGAGSLPVVAHVEIDAEGALDAALETSVCCRTIRRLTGATWTEARE